MSPISDREARIDAVEAHLIATGFADGLEERSSTYFDREGRPISFVRWVAITKVDPDYKIVARTELDGVLISTVWLGLDHAYGRALGPPLIYETMIFGGPVDLDEYQERYSTEGAAVTGHDAAVRLVRRAQAES